MRRIPVWAAAAAVICAVGLSAQGKPDFSGTWVVTTPVGAGSPPGDDAGVIGLCGQECTIKQDAKTFTLTRTFANGDQVWGLNLDGVETTLATLPGGDGSGPRLKATWNGATLVITIYLDRGERGPLLLGTMTLSMNAGRMEVEMINTPASFGGESSSKRTYTRK